MKATLAVLCVSALVAEACSTEPEVRSSDSGSIVTSASTDLNSTGALMWAKTGRVRFGGSLDQATLANPAAMNQARFHMNMIVPANELKVLLAGGRDPNVTADPFSANLKNFDNLITSLEQNDNTNWVVKGHVFAGQGFWDPALNGGGVLDKRWWLYSTMYQTMLAVIRRVGVAKLDSWDVINEFIGDDGNFNANVSATGLWPWATLAEDRGQGAYERTYEATVEIMKAARLAARLVGHPNLKLFVNEYALEQRAQELRRDGYYRWVSRLAQERDAAGKYLLDGIGHQLHLSTTNFAEDESLGTLDRAVAPFLDLGRVLGRPLEVHFSEVDVHHNREQPVALFGNRVISDQEFIDVVQPKLYLRIGEWCRAMPSCTAIITWGVSDRDSWIRSVFGATFGANQKPLLFDDQSVPKPALAYVRWPFLQ
jgi:GH35 family endo-1,4-beta-xylanase